MTNPARKLVRPAAVPNRKEVATPQARKREQILTAARDLFLQNGFDGVTMDLVTTRSAVSKATLYVYFKSKEELFAAALEVEIEHINAEVLAPFDAYWASGEDIAVVLAQIARTFIEMFLSERTVAMQRAIYGALPRFREVGKLVFGAGPTELIGRLSALLARAHERGTLEVPDPNVAARQFVSLARDEFDLIGILMLPRPDERTIARSIESSIDLFMARYGIDRGHPRA